jgi:hypothetical protein
MRVRVVTVLACAALLLAAPAFAQEHPEHPKGGSKEHPEHPGESKGAVTIEELAEAIESYIDRDAELKGGFFLVYDKVDKKPLQLTLVKIHDDKLAGLGSGVYFACVDMKNADGVVYDLDFFMHRDDHDEMETTEVSVHKKSGTPRYGWKEENGVWKKAKP